MSYLLDALRKADQQRQLGTVPGLDSVQPDAPTVRAPNWAIWITVGVVILNITVLSLLMVQWFGLLSESRANAQAPKSAVQTTTVQATQASMRTTKTGQMDKNVVQQTDQKQTDLDDGNTINTERDRVKTTESHQKQNETPLVTEPNSQTRPTSRGKSAVHTVRQQTKTAPMLRSLSSQVRADLPEYTVNGHLYSSVSGLSFVLINDGRYHEGGRLPGGGVVKDIDAEGVVIRYKERTFRLPAPH